METLSESPARGEHGQPRGPGWRLKEMMALAFTVLSLAAVSLVHLPWLPLQAQAAGHSFTNLIGQEHRWNMFSADPRGVSLDMWATVEFQDGSTEVWRIDRDVIGGDFRYYRWVKWMESAILLEPDRQLRGLAGWIIAEAPKPVDRVTIYGQQKAPGLPGKPKGAATVSVLGELRP